MTIRTVKSIFPWNVFWIGGVIAGLNSGCAGNSALEQDFGQSVKHMQYVQTYDKTTILEPQLEPVKGMNGEAAANTLKDYHKTFSKPTTDPVKQEFIFNIGGMGGGGGGGQ